MSRLTCVLECHVACDEYFVHPRQYISPPSFGLACEKKRLSDVKGSSLDKWEGCEFIEPPSINKCYSVSRVVTLTSARVIGLSSPLSWTSVVQAASIKLSRVDMFFYCRQSQTCQVRGVPIFDNYTLLWLLENALKASFSFHLLLQASAVHMRYSWVCVTCEWTRTRDTVCGWVELNCGAKFLGIISALASYQRVAPPL